MTDLARRDFLRVATAAPFALRSPQRAKSYIVLVLTGGPSHLDTWDMKPDAPSEIRGPFQPIRTNVPGIEISEIFPRMAKHADKYSIVRGVYSRVARPEHEHGLRRLYASTGHFARVRIVSRAEPEIEAFRRNCIRASQLVENGTRFVRVDMFDTIFQRRTWDCHGTRPFSTIRDYKDSVGPAFDLGYTTLLEELHQRGLLESTLVLAIGDFGRTPRINPSGGRDHWTKCQTALLAGGGIEGGQIFGSSDATGSEPKDDPISVDRLFDLIPARHENADWDPSQSASYSEQIT